MNSASNPKKHILLTGGSGFIGKNIIEQLGSKYVFFAPDYQELDLLDTFAVEAFFATCHIDTVIHAANIGVYAAHDGVNETSAKNILMFLNLARQLKPEQQMIFLG